MLRRPTRPTLTDTLLPYTTRFLSRPNDATHDPSRKSWVQSSNSPDTDFPIQNLPLGIFSRDGSDRRPGVAIGAHILDLRTLDAASLLPEDLSLLLTGGDRKSTRLNSSHYCASRMPSSACNKKTRNKRRRNSR